MLYFCRMLVDLNNSILCQSNAALCLLSIPDAFLYFQADYHIISASGSMLQEYGICMSLIRSTSAALYICDNIKRESEGSVSDDGDRGPAAATVRLTVSGIVDILCYVCYLPLFFAGPLMTYENFHRQVGAGTEVLRSFDILFYALLTYLILNETT